MSNISYRNFVKSLNHLDLFEVVFYFYNYLYYIIAIIMTRKLIHSINEDVNILQEVKKGKFGSGLLLERDGHIFDGKDTIKQINEDIKNGHQFVCPDHFVVSAVFQKFGIKNANGRIYPEAILKREVEKYITERVNNRCAFGALDHPSCFVNENTMVLTEKGWKKICDIVVGENILTLNNKKEIEIKPVLKTIKEEYNGEVYHFKGRCIDTVVTPQHKFPLLDRYQNYKCLATAEQLYNNEISDQNHSYFYKNGMWHNDSDEFFVIPGIDEREFKKCTRKDIINKYKEDLLIPMSIWAKFFGIYLSEGWVTNVKNRPLSIVCLAQKKKEICVEIENLLDEFPIDYSIETNKNGCNYYSLIDMRLAKYLHKFGKCYDKYIPLEFKKQGRDILRIFYDWFVMGDGRKRGVNKTKYLSDDVFSTSKQLVLDLNEIQLKIGYNGSYHKEDRNNDRLIEGRIIKSENSHPMHFTFKSRTKNISLAKKSLSITKEHHNGFVYCIEVENHTFYIMGDDGHCLWSGNSTTLSGHDVTHNILSLDWQGHTLIGEMELHLSPGYKQYGVCSTSGDMVANMLLSNYLVGVSSRGVGTVIQKPGNILMVDDDFDLIGWDVVLEPSTPGANIGKNREDLQMYVENDICKSDKNIINENNIPLAKEMLKIWG